MSKIATNHSTPQRKAAMMRLWYSPMVTRPRAAFAAILRGDGQGGDVPGLGPVDLEPGTLDDGAADSPHTVSMSLRLLKPCGEGTDHPHHAGRELPQMVEDAEEEAAVTRSPRTPGTRPRGSHRTSRTARRSRRSARARLPRTVRCGTRRRRRAPARRAPSPEPRAGASRRRRAPGAGHSSGPEVVTGRLLHGQAAGTSSRRPLRVRPRRAQNPYRSRPAAAAGENREDAGTA